MVPNDFSEVAQTLNRVIPMFDSTPITAELYTCWKFSGLEGKTEEEYRQAVSAFVQCSGIPAVIDAVCRGCVAVIMHGPRWLWWYLTAYKEDIKETFSDLKSITQMDINGVTELIKDKDNERFKTNLEHLHTQMISHNIPTKLEDKYVLYWKC